MENPINTKRPGGSVKNASAGRIKTTNGPMVPNAKGSIAPTKGLTTTNKC